MPRGTGATPSQPSEEGTEPTMQAILLHMQQQMQMQNEQMRQQMQQQTDMQAQLLTYLTNREVQQTTAASNTAGTKA